MLDTELRNRVRNTYGLCSRKNASFPVSIRFFVANNASPVEKIGWDLFHMEMTTYNDIVWDKGFIDSYRNLSIKMIRALRWTEIHFPNVWFVVKLDLDVFFSLPNLINYLSTSLLFYQIKNETFYKNSSSIIIGNFFSNNRAIRNANHKWFVPKSEYPFDVFPRYALGLFYILNRQIISVIVRNFSNYYENKSCRTADLKELSSTFCATTRQILSMEDILITGLMVMNMSKLQRVGIYGHFCYECDTKFDYNKIVFRFTWNVSYHNIEQCKNMSATFD